MLKKIGIAALARCKDGDPQRAIDAIKVSDRPHLHLFIATSDIHLTHKLRTTREAALAEAVKWVKYARERLGRGVGAGGDGPRLRADPVGLAGQPRAGAPWRDGLAVQGR